MKRIILFLFLFTILTSSCSYIFEKKVFEPECVVTGFVFDSKKMQIHGRTNQREEFNCDYYVVVIDSCKNQKTFETTYDCYNSLKVGDDVKVYTTKNKHIFEIKKYLNQYE